ncbi:VacJ family lipoprotein [Siccirubricoccus sp. KC 17139]|uniref:VacJ family lipoprotein n=1 Tax=Siccirubricoccus soli TaxID=2899147 RepID=A0ABT1DD46_9PROT|nr:VacJ family lipoprotein [Siccirubricoccus soli]MCO6419140.1 VacJ family lipoprotein [Siccirubricoccus soli]MCP2685275.1 VacJ family lipoprotein [Siccirubricoccus soli]
MRRLAALSLSVLLAACATQGPVTDPTDPLEASNRQVFDVNMALDRNIFRPVAVFYRNTFGDWTRARIHNALQNVNEPVVAVNALLQGQPDMAAQSLLRFVINSIGGLGGMFDLESIGGPPRIIRDFGQTLYVWGVPDGPFLMVPVLGPSNPRELAGVISDGFLNPITWVIPVEASLGQGVVSGIDMRERNIETLDEIEATSLDLYARLRSLWRQHRDAELGRSTTEAPAVLEDPDAPSR